MTRKPRFPTRPLTFEILEDRLTPASISDGGSSTLTILLNAGESLSVRSQGSNYRFDSAQSFTNGGVQQSGDFGGLNTTTMSLNNLGRYTNINIRDNASNAEVVFQDSGANSYTTNFDVLLDNTSAGVVRFAGATNFGTKNLTAASNKQINVNAATVTTSTGNLTLLGNVQTATSGGDIGGGVVLFNATVQTTSTGTLTVRGHGGDSSGGNQFGIWVLSSSQIRGGTTGTTLIEGSGGNSSGSFNHGVYVTGANSKLTTNGSELRVVGKGGSTGAGGSGRNIGVYADGTSIAAGGSGATNVTGTAGGGGAAANHGVWVRDVNAIISSSGGPVNVIGNAAGNAASTANFGVAVEIGGLITAGGMGTVRVEGYGAPLSAATAGDNQGVQVSGSDAGVYQRPSFITSNGGAVTVIGKGGGNGPLSLGNIGVYVFTGGVITAGGTAALNITGTGGDSAGQENIGVRVDGEFGGDTKIVTGGGPLTINGTGGNGKNRFNVGVHLVFGGIIQPGGSGALVINGNGGTGTQENAGVVVDFPAKTQFGGRASLISSTGGSVTITGKAGPGNANDTGVSVVAGGQVSVGGNGPLVITGTGGSTSSSSAFGILVQGAATTITTAGGDLTMTGVSGTNSIGVLVNQGAKVSAGRLGTTKVTGFGNGSSGGVIVTDANSLIASSGGNVIVAGKPGSSANATDGVVATNGGRIQSVSPGTTTIDNTGSSLNPPPVTPPTTPPTTPPVTPPVTPPTTPPTTPPVTPPVTPPTTPPTTPPVVPPGTTSPRLIGYPQYAVGAGPGGGPNVRFFNPDGSERSSILAFESGFTGGVRTASADFNGDGVADIVVGSGPGRSTNVRVLNGVDPTSVLFTIDPFEPAFTGGVFVATGDINGDNIPDLVITPDEGGGPRARVFSGAGFGQILDFFGIDDSSFRGGARAAVGDLNGDGKSELVVAAGFGGGPRITVWDGARLTSTGPAGASIANFFAFETALRNGSYVAVGDVDGDGKADLIFGGGPGGGPRVRIFNGPGLLGSTFTNVDEIGQFQQANFFAGDVNNRGGILVAVKNLDGDNRADVMVGSGTGGGSRVTAYAGKNITSSGTPPTLLDGDTFAGFTGGVFVG